MRLNKKKISASTEGTLSFSASTFQPQKQRSFFLEKIFRWLWQQSNVLCGKGRCPQNLSFLFDKMFVDHGPFKSVCFCIIIRPNMITIRSLKAHGLTCHVWFLLAFWKVKGYRFRWWTVFTNAIELWTDEYRGLKAQKKAMQSRGVVTAVHITPQSIIMTHCSSAHIITSSNHMQIISPLSSHFGSAAICSFKSFVQKDSRFQSISEGLGRGRCLKLSSCHWVCRAIKVSHGFFRLHLRSWFV